MKKLIFQGLVIVALFFALWFSLRAVNWVKLFKIEKLTNNTQKKLGDLFWETFLHTEKINSNPEVERIIDSIVQKICVANSINYASIQVHIIIKEEVNAFALPNGHLLIYSGLIAESKNADALSGVICHELAHIQLNHVMQKLIKQVGLSVLTTMTNGSGGAEIIKKTLHTLSSTAFDRSLEKEADLKAVDYLIQAKANPLPFAMFLKNLSTQEKKLSGFTNWISTHPDPIERAKYIADYCKTPSMPYQSIISNQTWSSLQNNLHEQ